MIILHRRILQVKQDRKMMITFSVHFLDAAIKMIMLLPTLLKKEEQDA